MLTAQPLSPSSPIRPIKSSLEDVLTRIESKLSEVQTSALVRYEFILNVQVREFSRTLYKTMLSPLLPMTCNNITIATGYYKIVRTRLDMVEKIVNVWLEPLVANPPATTLAREAFEQIIKEHKGEGWYE